MPHAQMSKNRKVTAAKRASGGLNKADRDVLKALKKAEKDQADVIQFAPVREPLVAPDSTWGDLDINYSMTRPMDIACLGS
jgi:hypothetical protein